MKQPDYLRLNRPRKVARLLTCPQEIIMGKATSSMLRGGETVSDEFFCELSPTRGLKPYVFGAKKTVNEQIPTTLEQKRGVVEVFDFDGQYAMRRIDRGLERSEEILRFRFEILDGGERRILEIKR